MTDPASTPELTPDRVAHLARLARLRVADDEVESTTRDLDAILASFRQLDALDLDGIEPLTHPGEMTNRLADDAVDPSLARERALDLAAVTRDVFFAVPKVIDGAGGSA